MSIEQRDDFIVLRRLLKGVAADYVLYTTSALPASHSSLDVDKKIISISENTDIPTAIASALFQIGRLSSHLNPREESADVATAMYRADKAAAKWAFNSYMLFWSEADAGEIREIINGMVRSIDEWTGLMAE
jgi:hypothetical protein